jgi:hypothetical protein
MIVGRLCGTGWDIYIVLFSKMGFGYQEDVYFQGVEKCFYFFMLWFTSFAFHAAMFNR